MEAKKHIDGVLLVDKKSGITSHDVVEVFRRRARIKKVGHTGTLDPLATGLLVLCVGKATRLQSYLMGMEKAYEGTIQFGWATDSYDAAGAPALCLRGVAGKAGRARRPRFAARAPLCGIGPARGRRSDLVR